MTDEEMASMKDEARNWNARQGLPPKNLTRNSVVDDAKVWTDAAIQALQFVMLPAQISEWRDLNSNSLGVLDLFFPDELGRLETAIEDIEAGMGAVRF